ncbi:MAG: M56 family metallopeptidase, partial [Gemmatimonadota bacterium]
METIIGQFVGANGVMQPAALSVLASAAAKSALVLIGAWIVTLALRRGSAATRHLVWSVAIVAALALPLAVAVLPSWPVAVSVPGLAVAESGDDDASTDTGAAASVATTEGSSAAGGGAGVAESTVRGAEGAPATAAGAASETRAGTSAVLGGGVGDEAGEAATNASGPTAAVAAASGRSWGGIALFVWLGGMLVVAGGMLVGLIRVRRLSRRARPVTEGRVAARVRELSGRLGLREAPRVLRGEAEAMPMTWGVASPSVYLPMEADAWSDERLDAVLLHELAHVRRRDYPIQLAAELVCALYWFNPLAWLAARRLRVERERACDDHALFAGARPSTYAGELLELARSLRPARATASATMSMARPSQLTGRLLAVLDEGRPRRVV